MTLHLRFAGLTVAALVMGAAAFTGPVLAPALAQDKTAAGAETATQKTAHDFTFQGIDGTPLPLAQYRGKVLVVVNTASECGFTYQYKGLQGLWDEYRDRGVVVLGVPSNDFGRQEPGDAKEIKEFCETVFGVDFPMADKTPVTGDEAHPFYAWARGSFGDAAIPRWNFHKLVVGQDGVIVAAFPSATEPMDKRVTGLIEGLLPEGIPAPGQTEKD